MEEIRFSVQAKKWECPSCEQLCSFEHTTCTCGFDSTPFVMEKLKAADTGIYDGPAETTYNVKDLPRAGFVDPASNTWMCPKCKTKNEDIFQPVCSECGEDASDMLAYATKSKQKGKSKKKKRGCALKLLASLFMPALLFVSGGVALYLLLAASPLLIYGAPVFLIVTIVFVVKDDREKKKKVDKASDRKQAISALAEQVANLAD